MRPFTNKRDRKLAEYCLLVRTMEHPLDTFFSRVKKKKSFHRLKLTRLKKIQSRRSMEILCSLYQFLFPVAGMMLWKLVRNVDLKTVQKLFKESIARNASNNTTARNQLFSSHHIGQVIMTSKPKVSTTATQLSTIIATQHPQGSKMQAHRKISHP